MQNGEIMARTKVKGYITPYSAPPDLSVPQTIGVPWLPSSIEVANAVKKAVEKYCVELAAERKAFSVADGLKLIHAIRGPAAKLAQKIEHTFYSASRDEFKIGDWIRAEIQDRNMHVLGNLKLDLEQLRSALEQVESHFEEIQTNFKDHGRKGQYLPHGRAWRQFVLELAEIFRSNGLKPTARKDSDTSDASSPFVEFVWKVSKELLHKDTQQHIQSPEAMAFAIQEAFKISREKY